MNYSKCIFSVIFMLGFGMILFAAPPSSTSSGGSAPIDGGISLLIAGVIGYGVKRIRDNHKKVKAQIAI